MAWSRSGERERLNQEMEDEFRFHIEQRTAELIRAGLSPEQAARKAKQEFGSLDKYKEAGRGVWFWRAWSDAIADSKFAIRMLLKSPAFTVAAVLTLALGIGATTAIFSLVYGVLYRPLPFPNADRVAMVYMHFSPQNNPRGTMSLADFMDWRNSHRSFERVAAISNTRFALSGIGTSEQVTGASVTADFFAVLGMQPVRGRTFLPGEDSPASEHLIVISESLWKRKFNGDDSAIGKTIEVNGQPATIIGVVAGSFGVGNGDIEVWQNQSVNPKRRGPFFFRGLGLLRPGVTFAAAQEETNAVGKQIEQANPGSYSRLSMPIEPLRTALTFRVRSILFVIFASVVAVLMISTVNITNLLLARASARRHEMAVRISLGASRGRLVRQMLTESVILALIGGGAGVVLAYGIIQTLKVSDVTGLPLTYQVSMNGWVLAFSVIVSVITGLAFGLAPGLQSFHAGVAEQLKSGKGETGAKSRFQFGRSALVVSEVALSFALVVAAGLLYRSLLRLQEVDAGFTAPAKQVLTMQIAPKPTRGGNPDPNAEQLRMASFYQSVIERVQQLPETAAVGVSDSLPPAYSGEDDTFVIAGQPWNERAFPSTTTPKVSPDYFKALGIPVIRGRVFSPSDTASSAPVVVISETLAKKYFPNVDPVGQRLAPSSPSNNNAFAEIVGVVGDVKYWGLNADNYAAYYQVYTQNSGPGMFLIVRSSGDAAAMAREVEASVREIDKEAVVRKTLTLQQVVDESVTQPRFRTTLLMSFALLALVLAGMGIYGVMAYSVSQRTQELGIRMALGAPRASVIALVMRHGAFLTISGMALGLLASLASGRVLSSFLFGIGAMDPVALAEGSLVLALIAMTATLIPALRAIRIQPVEALRQT